MMSVAIGYDDCSIFLIRHGRTAGNGRRYVGWEDAPLDEYGRAQSERVARLLAGQRIDAIFTSTLSRAIATSLPLAVAQRIPMLGRPDLREIDYGRLQGAPKAEHRLRLRHDYRTVALPGGESLRDVYERAATFAAELSAAIAAGWRVAVVGHFWSNRMLAGALLGLPFEQLPAGLAYKPGNGSIAGLVWPAGAHCAAVLALLDAGEEEAE
jgi:probable phosphoglycerate mutase